MNQMEVSFSAILDNENFARTTVAAFLTPLNPTIDEIIEYQTLQKQHLQQILKNQTPIPLTESMMEDILKDYDVNQGARTLLKQMKKYLVSKNR